MVDEEMKMILRFDIGQLILENVRSENDELYGVDPAVDAIADLVLTQCISRIQAEAEHSVGAYIDGLYAAIDILRDELKVVPEIK
jgi:hypothetical protein